MQRSGHSASLEQCDTYHPNHIYSDESYHHDPVYDDRGEMGPSRRCCGSDLIPAHCYRIQ